MATVRTPAELTTLSDALFTNSAPNLSIEPEDVDGFLADLIASFATPKTHLLPDADNTYDLGSVAKSWRDGYFDGTLNAASVVGALTGNVTGNLTGNVTGDVTGALTGAVVAPNGSAGTPSYRFANSLDAGFYRGGAGQIGVASGGAKVAEFGATYLSIGASGAAASGELRFANDAAGIMFASATSGDIRFGTVGSDDIVRYGSGSNQGIRLITGSAKTVNFFDNTSAYFDVSKSASGDPTFNFTPGSGRNLLFNLVSTAAEQYFVFDGGDHDPQYFRFRLGGSSDGGNFHLMNGAGNQVFTVWGEGYVNISSVAVGDGSVPLLKLDPGNHINLGDPSFPDGHYVAFNDTYTWQAGSGRTLAQTAVLNLRQGTWTGTGVAAVTTDAYTMIIEGAPIAGSLHSFTRSGALWLKAGNLEFGSTRAGAGLIRLPNDNLIGWRDSGNSANHTFGLNGSDIFALTTSLTLPTQKPLFLGAASQPSATGGAGMLAIMTDVNNGSINMSSFIADVTGTQIEAMKSRHATIGSHTVVVSGDNLLSIIADGSDGSAFRRAAAIRFQVDGTVTGGGAADMPGRIRFQTTPDGSATLADIWDFNNAGHLVPIGTRTIGVTGTRVSNAYFTNITSTNAVTVDSWGRTKKGITDYDRSALDVVRGIRVVSYEHELRFDPTDRRKLGVLAETVAEPLVTPEDEYNGLGMGPRLDMLGLAALNTKAIQELERRLVAAGI